MIYKVVHTTTYDYGEPVSLCHNVFHLAVRSCYGQVRRSSDLRISPAPSIMTERLDFFGNTATFATIEEAHRELCVTAVNVVDLVPGPPPRAELTPPWESVHRDQLRSDASPDVLAASQFVFDSPYVPTAQAFADYAAPSFRADRPILEAVRDLTFRIHDEFRYDPTATTIATPIKEVLEQRHGVCQDFAHLQIGCLRSLGLAARYVSGYLVNTRPTEPSLVGSEASHAWVSVFCPGVGWVDIDPTNNQVPCDHHIVLAWGRDYDDVSPLKGVILGGGSHTVEVEVEISPIVATEPPPSSPHQDEPDY